MPGNIAGRRSRSLPRRSRRGGRIGSGWRSGHFGHDLVEQHGASLRLLLATFAVAIGMLGVAGLADYFRDFAVNHAGNGVVQKKAAARTVIVD